MASDHLRTLVWCSRKSTDLAADELAAVEKLQKAYHNMRAELGKVIVGQEEVIEELLIALFCRGHACWSACRAWPRRC